MRQHAPLGESDDAGHRRELGHRPGQHHDLVVTQRRPPRELLLPDQAQSADGGAGVESRQAADPTAEHHVRQTGEVRCVPRQGGRDLGERQQGRATQQVVGESCRPGLERRIADQRLGEGVPDCSQPPGAGPLEPACHAQVVGGRDRGLLFEALQWPDQRITLAGREQPGTESGVREVSGETQKLLAGGAFVSKQPGGCLDQLAFGIEGEIEQGNLCVRIARPRRDSLADHLHHRGEPLHALARRDLENVGQKRVQFLADRVVLEALAQALKAIGASVRSEQ